MSFGLYLHIPYCLSKCSYCNFYSAGGSTAVPDDYIHAMLREIEAHKAYHPKTVYFGGGTPSLLTTEQLAHILSVVQPAQNAEITLEVNPETASLSLLQGYRCAGVNRLSIGVQSAYNHQLEMLGRRHTSQTAAACFQMALQAGFTNISGDIMLALPGYSTKEFDNTLRLISQGGATHISSYLLKVEPGTPLSEKPLTCFVDDDTAADFYLYAVNELEKAGYRQYEISNFSKPGFESRHNLVYWNCEDYLGIGPAAHSCMRNSRFFYPPNTSNFISGASGTNPDGSCTAEDFIMLQLRLTSGLSLPILKQRFAYTFSQNALQKLPALVKAGLCTFRQKVICLTPQGMLVQNYILAQLLG